MVFLLWSLTLAMFFHGTASALIVNNKILLSSLCIYFWMKKINKSAGLSEACFY